MFENLSSSGQSIDELWLESFVQILDLEAKQSSSALGESSSAISHFLHNVSSCDLIRRTVLFNKAGEKLLHLTDTASELLQQKLNIETSLRESTPTEADYGGPLPLVEVGVSRLDKDDCFSSKLTWSHLYLGQREINVELSRRMTDMCQARDQQAEEVSLLTHITNSIISSLDMKRIFHVITTKIAKLINFDRASIVLIDESSDKVLAYVLVTQSDSNYREGIYPLKGTAQEWVLKHRKTCIDKTLNNRTYRENRGLFAEGLRSSIRVPLFFRGNVIGTFNLDSRRVGAYTDVEQRLLEQVAGQIAIAVENSRLYDEALRRSEEISAINNSLEIIVQSQTAKVKELERKRAMLTGLIAHSLKSPIIGIRRALNMLAVENDCDAAGRGLLDELCSSCDLLLGIVNDMLDVYRYEFDSVPLYLSEPVEISDPINNSLWILRHQITEKHLEIVTPVNQGFLVIGDSKRLSRIFVNLLENAVRYSPNWASIYITSTFVKEKNGCFIKISIEDEGMGIPEQELGRIFDQFYQVERNVSIESGSGLGLCYCKMIVEAHGGSIWAENRRHGGTAFRILLPACRSKECE